MGVVYRLIPEVSSFIIQEKQSDPKVTCKNLAGRVFLKFGHPVSKSSVHELLKQSHVITPRVRKLKDKFQIPLEKKVEISKALAPFVQPDPLTVEHKATEQVNSVPEIKDQKLAAPLIHTEAVSDQGNIFLKAAWWDLSFKPVLGLKDFSEISTLNNSKLKFEWGYLTQNAYAIKIETQNSKTFYIDCRFQGLYEQAPAQESLATTIDRAACEIADTILNNINPLILRTVEQEGSPSPVLEDFINAFENKPGCAIKKVSLIGLQEQVLAEFLIPVPQERQYIIRGQRPFLRQDLADEKGRCPLITNLKSMSYEEVIKAYEARNPSTWHDLTPVIYNLKELMDNQSQWLTQRLKERALMFFPSGFSLNALEETLGLPGTEAFNAAEIQIQLQISEEFKYREELKVAIENINNLYIKDNRARKLSILV